MSRPSTSDSLQSSLNRARARSSHSRPRVPRPYLPAAASASASLIAAALDRRGPNAQSQFSGEIGTTRHAAFNATEHRPPIAIL
jgi:hypothetical protein